MTSRSMIQSLLSEIYAQYQLNKQFDSSTETSCISDGCHVNCRTSVADIDGEVHKKLQVPFLTAADISQLNCIKQELDERITVVSAKLVRQLKQRNRLRDKHVRHCDTITAVLQAVSQKRRVDTQLKFNLEPLPSDDGFRQWCDALRAIVRLPGGLPACWRKRVWVSNAEHYFKQKHSGKEWSNIQKWVFSDRVCTTDESLSNQIVKDLHRTGYTNIISVETDKQEDRLLLKRVLLAYARWNQEVGYCQGFNVLAALLLKVTEGDYEAAFKIMVYLIDEVLPDSYFANNLQALSVDMAVFRDLLKVRLPQLSKHLDQLQKEANENLIGSNYEPPLTNVFTMQWFLTLFATCLPSHTVLRIWDSLILDGNEILLRVALAVWSKTGEKVSEAQTADEFYSIMSRCMQDAVNGKLIQDDELVRMVYKVAAFPFPHLSQLREKYTYNITPFMNESSEELSPGSGDIEKGVRSGGHTPVDDIDAPFFCFTGLVSPGMSAQGKKLNQQAQNLELAANHNQYSPHVSKPNTMMSERMSTDIAALKQQYMAIRARQSHAHLVYAKPITSPTSSKPSSGMISYFPNKAEAPMMMNHLLIGRTQNPVNLSSSLSIQVQHGRSGRSPRKKKHKKSLAAKLSNDSTTSASSCANA